MKKYVTILLVAFVSFGAYAQHDHSNHADQKQEEVTPTFKDEKLGTAYLRYIHLKDALVASDSESVKKASAEFKKSLSAIPAAKKVESENAKILASTDLTEQRKAFSLLSNEMTTLVKSSKLSTGSIYVEYCPMANNNEGAFWLSNEKEIKNPYFGDMMLKCGSVKETLQ